MIHEVANMFPMMSAEEFAALKADINDNGQQEDIWLHPDDNSIIDGRNRYKACIELGITPKFKTWHGVGSLVNFVSALNLHRRHLDSSQKAMISVRAKNMYAEEARKRQAAGHFNAPQYVDVPVQENFPELDTPKGQARDKAAEQFGTNARYVSFAEKVKRTDEAVANMVVQGQVNMPSAVALVELAEPYRKEAIEKIEKGEKPKKAIQAVKKRIQKEKAQSVPTGTYNVILADPPWQYDNTGLEGAAINHYDTMAVPELCDLLTTIELGVSDNAVLFMWVTAPMLDVAMEVVNAWGFDYKTNIVWHKLQNGSGLGHYVRVEHELLLICTRGSFTPLTKHPISSILATPLREHSRKPDESYEIIERLYPDCSYIELFARTKRDGWDAWGNEVGKF